MTNPYFLILVVLLVLHTTRADLPLEFEYRNTVRWPSLGPSASVGNGLFVAYNGTHTLAMDENTHPNSTNVANYGYSAWELIETNEGPSRRISHQIAFLTNNGLFLVYGGVDVNNSSKYFNDAYLLSLSYNEKNEQVGTWTRTTDGPSARSDHQMTTFGQQILTYGGHDDNGNFNDAYLFSLSSNEKNEQVGTWTRTTDGPSSRFNHRMASMGQNILLMYGGMNTPYPPYLNPYLNDAYIVSLSTNGDSNGKNEKIIWTRTTDGPSARAFHDMASIGPNILMYGGCVDSINGLNCFNDAYLFSLSSNETNGKVGTWTKTVDGPSARGWHQMVSIDHNVLMYGGYGSNNNIYGSNRYINDAYIFSFVFNIKNEKVGKWTRTKDVPSARWSHQMAAIGPDILMYGGKQIRTEKLNGRTQYLDDAFLFSLSYNEKNGQVGTWIRTADGPSARINHQMATIDPYILMYGGNDDKNKGTHKFNDAYLFSLSSNTTNAKVGTWTRTTDGPSARQGHQMATIGEHILMYGGCGNYGPLNDAYFYSLLYSNNTKNEKVGTWTRSTDGPSGRTAHAMASIGQRILMFGGQNSSALFKDTHLFSLSSNTNTKKGTVGIWTKTTHADGPSARQSHQMVSFGYNRVVLYGGSTKSGLCGSMKSSSINLFNDVWMYHGDEQDGTLARWSRLENAMFKRFDFAMAPILLSNQQHYGIAMFGGIIDPATSPGFATSNNAWTMSVGCPPGSKGDSCELCPKTQWKGNTTNNITFSCLPCPPGTEATKPGATSKSQCTVCTDIFIGGEQCLAIRLAILFTLLAIAIPTIIWYIWQSWKKHFNATVQDMEYDYEQMDYELNTKLKDAKDDQLKLQKAWIVQLSDIKLEQVIGKGAFGEVRKGRWRGLDVAVKKMFPENMEKFGYDKMTATSDTESTEHYSNTTTKSDQINEIALTMLSNLEIGVMMRISHPRIVKFLGAGEIIDPPLEGDDVPKVGIFVMLEYASGGDLIHRLKAAAGSITLFPWIDRIRCAMDIAEGMAYIHAEGFLHRDLKSLNVLCDQNGRCMIADLGLACSNIRPPTNEDDEYPDMEIETKTHTSIQFNQHIPFGGDTNYNTRWQGTAAWMAPEVMGNNYGFKADVYSFGIVMYELLTCIIPWSGVGGYNFTHQILMAVTRGERPSINESNLINVPEGFLKLMKCCWATDPKARPTFNEVLEELMKILDNNGRRGSGQTADV